ncbi:MAG: hypothetical protein ACLSVD_00935 [Eggerthellaceae bacterium]
MSVLSALIAQRMGHNTLLLDLTCSSATPGAHGRAEPVGRR